MCLYLEALRGIAYASSYSHWVCLDHPDALSMPRVCLHPQESSMPPYRVTVNNGTNPMPFSENDQE